MSRVALLVVLLAISAGTVWAHKADQKELAKLKENGKVKISRQDCRHLVRYRPGGNVIYKAGVDVHGRKVTPADLSSNTSPLPETLVIDLTLPLRRLYPSAKPRALGRSNIVLGRITVDALSGKTLYNGAPLAGDAQARLITFCDQAVGKKAQ